MENLCSTVESVDQVVTKTEKLDGNDLKSESTEYESSQSQPAEPVYIQVAESEDDEAIELPCEPDGSILLSTVSSQFPGASGLKFRNPETKTLRGLRLVDGKLMAPEKGWTAYSVYYCVFPRENKRKADESEATPKSRKAVDQSNVKTSDLIVLGLPWKITEKELRTYFEQFGQVDMIQIKKDVKTGQSKGFGFVKFADYDIQMRVVTRRHNIHGRWCDVRVPLSKGEEQFNYQNSEFNRKIFVGRISEEFSVDDLRNYFKKFGEITDVFIPKPFRGFGFVTFLEPEVAQSLCGEEHTIKGVTTQISNAVPKVDFGASGYPHHASYSHASHHHAPHHHASHHHHASGHHPHHPGHMASHPSYGGGVQAYGNGGSYSTHSSPRYNPYGGYESRRSGSGIGSPSATLPPRSSYSGPTVPPPAHPPAHSNNGSPMVNSTYNHGPNQSYYR